MNWVLKFEYLISAEFSMDLQLQTQLCFYVLLNKSKITRDYITFGFGLVAK